MGTCNSIKTIFFRLIFIVFLGVPGTYVLAQDADTPPADDQAADAQPADAADTATDTPVDDVAADAADAVVDDATDGTADETTPADGAAESTEADAETATEQRRIRRLGDVAGGDEWEMEMSVPIVQAPAQPTVQAPSVNLPDPAQNQQLQDLLTTLTTTPGDTTAQAQLEQLLTAVIAQADIHIAADELTEANGLLETVRAINSQKRGLTAAQNRLRARGRLQNQLSSAQTAVDEGRFVAPENNNALFFYQQVLAQDAENEAAQQGLIAVQQGLIGAALQAAQDLDFETSEALLTQASDVREEQDLVTEAQQQIASFREDRAGQLEASAISQMDAGDFDTAESTLADLVALGGSAGLVTDLRRRLEEARTYGGFQPGQIIQDQFQAANGQGPTMVVIAAGSFLMGSPENERDRVDNEGPRHRVTFNRGFALGQSEITVDEFRAFINATGYQTDAQRFGNSTVYDEQSGRLDSRNRIDWTNDYEGRRARGDNAVVHVSWNDAQTYTTWLARETGKRYRLPSEAEFEYANRAGSSDLYWWGSGSPDRVVENVTGDGDASQSRRRWTVAFDGYTDDYWGPAQVQSFLPNAFGLYDMSGNLSEWVMDCWHDTYVRAPGDGTAWVNPGCARRVVRGGYWASSPAQTRAAFRISSTPDARGARVGFRVARDL